METYFDPETIIGRAVVVLSVSLPGGGIDSHKQTQMRRLREGADISTILDDDCYIDEHLSLGIHPAISAGGMRGAGLVIFAAPDESGAQSMVFSASFYIDHERDDPEVDVHRYIPGPWEAHLETLSQRAIEILFARDQSQEE